MGTESQAKLRQCHQPADKRNVTDSREADPHPETLPDQGARGEATRGVRLPVSTG